MKRILALLLCLFTLSVFAGCQTNEPSKNNSNDSKVENDLNNFEYEEVSGGLKITKYTGTSTKIVVPGVIENKAVVSVGTTFSGNVLLEEIELPSSVIEADFKNCTALKRLEAKGISSFGKIYLSGCESLEYLALPAITDLPSYGWELPSSIRELVLTGVEKFALYRFSGSLTSLEVLDISSATYIGVGYYSWPSKLKEVKINESITKYYIDSDTDTVGSVTTADGHDSGKAFDIVESNESWVWSELFSCKEIIVNGVTHKID